MHSFQLCFRLPSPNAALRSPRAFVDATMLGRAVSSHAASKPSAHIPFKPQQPNMQNHASNKRKFDRTMSSTSSLGGLHDLVQFDENDFDDIVDLTESPPKLQVHYPQLDKVHYADLPPAPVNQSPQPPASSAPVPWSSSPVSHFTKPPPPAMSPERVRPAKRRVLPWATVKPEEIKSPLPEDSKENQFAWNKSAAVVKDEQKEFRKRNRIKTVSKAEPKPSTVVTKEMLSAEQQTVSKVVIEEGQSVFFTGSAGTGKSVLMRSIISQFKHKHRKEPDRLAVTASTGLAACVIEGQTLHSWAGIGLGKEPVPELVKKIKKNAKTRQRWIRTKILVVDEISMVDGELFDKLEAIARMIRNNGRPFGGIQLVVTGDFFQLPPVPDRNTPAKFAFDAATWSSCIEHTILLTHVFRQKDPVFAGMLNEMRLGKLSPATVANFQRLSRPLDFKDDIEATELFPTRMEVDGANQTRMRMLSGQEMKFEAVDSGVSDLNIRNKMLANFMAPESISLKKGAQVMLIKNMDTALVNGSLGKVISFMDEATFSVYKDDEETFLQAQEPEGGSDEDEKAAARAKIASARLKSTGDRVPRYWPMVRFALPDGTFRELLIQPEEWKTENQQGEIVAKRNQIPLILAWALSIHKAQGQTLNRVKVDLGKVFERGQAYVALSRATSQAGLQVMRFDQKKVMVHPKVITFYEKLGSAEGMASKRPKTIASFVRKVEDNDDEYEYMNA
jgi:ATP-dependent DNA helicase PIF1